MIDKLTALDMHRAIYSHFSDRWAVLTEVTARAEYAPHGVQPATEGALFPSYQPPTKLSSHRRIDVLLVHTGATKASGGIERVAIEIKVSRGDFLNDVRDPDKQAPWRALAHRHAYAVPEDLVAETEVPVGSGLLVVKRSQYAYSGFTCQWTRKAVKPAGHEPGPLPLANLMDAFWRAARAEAKIKGHDSATARAAGEDPDEMRAELVRLRADVERLHKRVDREHELKAMWQRAYGVCTPPRCSTCGQPLHLSTSRRRLDAGTWTHRDPDHAAACEQLRRAAAVKEREAQSERFRVDLEYLWVPPPEPVDEPALA